MRKIPLYLRVTVTEQHMAAGVRRSGKKCPLALAIKEKYGDEPFVGGNVEIELDGHTVIYRNSRRANQFINNFDAFSVDSMAKAKPGTYWFRLRGVRS